MSQLFGTVRQIGFVVRDLDQALRYWTQTMAVGPFFVLRNHTPENYRYRGKPSPGPLMSIAFANSGDLQVELIQQLDDRPSLYREFLDAGREGFHHLSAWLWRSEYDAAMAKILATGAVIAHEGGTDTRFAYFATDQVPGGTLFEISEMMEPEMYKLVQMVANAARQWDGKDPVREL